MSLVALLSFALLFLHKYLLHFFFCFGLNHKKGSYNNFFKKKHTHTHSSCCSRYKYNVLRYFLHILFASSYSLYFGLVWLLPFVRYFAKSLCLISWYSTYRFYPNQFLLRFSLLLFLLVVFICILYFMSYAQGFETKYFFALLHKPTRQTNALCSRNLADCAANLKLKRQLRMTFGYRYCFELWCKEL